MNLNMFLSHSKNNLLKNNNPSWVLMRKQSRLLKNSKKFLVNASFILSKLVRYEQNMFKKNILLRSYIYRYFKVIRKRFTIYKKKRNTLKKFVSKFTGGYFNRLYKRYYKLTYRRCYSRLLLVKRNKGKKKFKRNRFRRSLVFSGRNRRKFTVNKFFNRALLMTKRYNLLKLKRLAPRRLSPLNKYQRWYYNDLSKAPRIYLLFRKQFFNIHKKKPELNLRFAKKWHKNYRRWWKKRRFRSKYKLPSMYKYIEEPRSTAKRDFFFVDSKNLKYKYKLRFRKRRSRKRLFRRSRDLVGFSNYHNFMRFSSRKLSFLCLSNNSRILRRLDLLLKNQMISKTLLKSKLLLSVVRKPELDVLFAKPRSLNNLVQQRMFWVLFALFPNQVIPVKELSEIVYFVHKQFFRYSRKERILYVRGIKKFYKFLLSRLNTANNLITRYHNYLTNSYRFYFCTVLFDAGQFTRFSLANLALLRIRRLFSVSKLFGFRGLSKVFRSYCVVISRLNNFSLKVSGLIKDSLRNFRFFIRNTRKQRNTSRRGAEYPVGNNKHRNFVYSNSYSSDYYRNITKLKSWRRFYKYKYGLPVNNRKSYIMRRVFFNIFSRKKQKAEVRALGYSTSLFIKDDDYYAEPWEYRALKRTEKDEPVTSRSRLRKLKQLLGFLFIRRVLMKSKFFYLNFKNFFSKCDFYFDDRIKRLSILDRDSIYYSKWGYVKFLKTRHNLFVSIYNRHHKLLHHTTAWASGSRRDPNRFSYKSLVFSARKLAARLWKLRFKKINVRLSSPVNFQIKLFLKTLKIKRIKVLDMLSFIKVSHNGLRPQKSRTQS